MNIPSININTGLETSDYHKTTDDIKTLDIEGISKVVEHVSAFIEIIQNKIVPTELKLYGNTKTRFGISLNYFNNNFNSEITPTILSFFILSPIGYSIMGDHYLRSGVGYGNSLPLTTDSKNYSLNIPISLALSQRILGLEMLTSAGIFYSLNLKNDKTINNSFGYNMSMEFKQYNNISYLNDVSLIIDHNVIYNNLFSDTDTKFDNYGYFSLKIGYYF